jgi:hypothetical protein
MLPGPVSTPSHITVLPKRLNQNTRLVPMGPRIDAMWLDEAYARARALPTPPMTMAGVRLVWSRGDEVGSFDLPASSSAFAVIGRHTKCDVVLAADPAVALRHLLVRAIRLEDETVAVRVLDLKTGLGFHLDDDVERRSLVASGPLAMRVGRYAIIALPSGGTNPEQRPVAEVIDAPRLPAAGASPWTTRVTTLPAAPLLEDIARDVAAPGHARVTLRRGPAWATVDLTEENLDAGVLVGRADRCEPKLRAAMTASVSRTHVLLLREQGDVHAFDLASTQGLYVGDVRPGEDRERRRPVRRVRLPDRGGTLRLASVDPVLLEWHPRVPVPVP